MIARGYAILQVPSAEFLVERTLAVACVPAPLELEI